MVCRVRGGHSLSRRTRGCDGGFLCGRPGGCMSRQGCLHGHPGSDFPVRPGTSHLQRVFRATIVTLPRKKVQHALGTIRRPARQKRVIGPAKQTAPMHRYESLISHRVGKNLEETVRRLDTILTACALLTSN